MSLRWPPFVERHERRRGRIPRKQEIEDPSSHFGKHVHSSKIILNTKRMVQRLVGGPYAADVLFNVPQLFLGLLLIDPV